MVEKTQTRLPACNATLQKHTTRQLRTVAGLWCFFAVAFLSARTQAQDKLTVRETGEISYQAKNVISELEQLLNFVAFADNAPNELAEVIRKSYTPETRSQIFYGKEVIIEDDIDPANRLGKTRDVPADKYLNTLDVFYEKSIDPSIRFSNIHISNVKKKDYFYVKVYFYCVFGSRYTKNNIPYQPQTRQATVRVTKKGNRWQALISGIGFHDPQQPMDSQENNVAVVSGGENSVSGNRQTSEAAQKSVRLAVDKVADEREAYERKARDAAYNEAIGIANAAMSENDYPTALDAYRRAVEYNSFAPLPYVQIAKIERLFTNQYESLLQKAETYEKSRGYEQAIDFYRRTLEAKPEAAAEIKPKINLLTIRVAETLSIRNKLAAGKTGEAIDECDALIKQKTKQKRISDYPDLYLLRAGGHAKSGQRNADSRALEDFAAAIQSDPQYLDAYLARASFHESQREWEKALTDYDYITIAILPQEAKYYLKKAQLKEQMGMGKRAVEDYDKAISLSPNNPLYHLQKGLLESRNRDWEAARRSFGRALELNVTYTEAYVRRGLAAAEQEKTEEAAADFRKAEKLGGLDSALIRFVVAKSNEYHNIGITALQNRNTKKAERMFDLALALYPKNSGVWLSRGDAHYKTGDFLKAIEFYSLAIQSNSRDASGYYKKGLAQVSLKQPKEALENYAAALRHDPVYLDVYRSRAEWYFSARQFNSATADYSRMIAILLPIHKEQQRKMQTDATLKRELAMTYTRLAKCHLATQAYQAAVENADQALVHDPSLAEAYYQRGLAYLALKKHLNAAEAFARAAKQQPDQLAYQYAHANAALRAAQYPDAVSAYSRVLALDNRQTLPDARFRRGICQYNLNKTDEALRDFTMHELNNPKETDADFLAYYGLAHLRKRHTNMAAKYLKKSLLLHNSNALALLGMGCLAAQQNKPAEALAWLKKAFQTKKLDLAMVRKEEESSLRDVRFGTSTGKQYSALRKASFPGSL